MEDISCNADLHWPASLHLHTAVFKAISLGCKPRRLSWSSVLKNRHENTFVHQVNQVTSLFVSEQALLSNKFLHSLLWVCSKDLLERSSILRTCIFEWNKQSPFCPIRFISFQYIIDSSSKIDLGKPPKALEEISNVRFINPSVLISSSRLISSKSCSCSRHRAVSQERIAALQVSAVGGYPSARRKKGKPKSTLTNLTVFMSQSLPNSLRLSKPQEQIDANCLAHQTWQIMTVCTCVLSKHPGWPMAQSWGTTNNWCAVELHVLRMVALNKNCKETFLPACH